MKKIFTLLVCIAGLAFAANATDVNDVQQCMNALLGHNGNPQMLNVPNMDPNQDGVLNIHDVTFLINEMLQEQQVNRAPARETDINALIKTVIETEGEPTIDDVTNAIDKKLKKDK